MTASGRTATSTNAGTDGWGGGGGSGGCGCGNSGPALNVVWYDGIGCGGGVGTKAG